MASSEVLQTFWLSQTHLGEAAKVRTTWHIMIVHNLEGIKTSKKKKKKNNKGNLHASQVRRQTQVYRESQETGSLSPDENQGILPQKPGEGVKGLRAAVVSWLGSLQTLRNRVY